MLEVRIIGVSSRIIFPERDNVAMVSTFYVINILGGELRYNGWTILELILKK